jgi:hypothetical protein
LGQGISLFWAPWAFWRSLTCRLKHVIFHSYVQKPEGISDIHIFDHSNLL